MNIVIPGAPEWIETIRPLLAANAVSVIDPEELADMIAFLADAHAALILIDGALTDWRQWAVTPRTSPATRRIPIVLVTDQPNIAAEARTLAVDRVLTHAELPAALPELLTTLARRVTDELAAAIRAECDEPLPPEAIEAIDRFNRGEYYKQHDLFEALWMRETRPIRDLYRAILQVGIAYYQLERGSWDGAHKMLLRSIQWLVPLPDVCQGIDVGTLKRDAAAVRAELDRVGRDGLANFDKRLIKPIRLIVP